MKPSDDDIRDALDRVVPLRPKAKNEPTFHDYVIAADALDAIHFPPVAFVVADLLPRGLALLTAPPKVGKTWLDMGMAHAVATGGLFAGSKPTDQGDVLLLDLEGNQRRAQLRFRAVRQGSPAPSSLHIANEWPRMDAGGLEMIRAWAKSRPNPRLIIIDTWVRFRPSRPKGADPYEHDYHTARALQELANELAVAIVAVHHNRKAADADWMAEASGSTGLIAAVDTMMAIRRDRGSADAVLHVAGRDVDDTELALAFDKETGLWSILGDAAEHRMGQTRRKIFAICSEGPKTPKEVADELDLNRDTIRKTLHRMFKDGALTCRDGRYAALSGTPCP